jgi:hypothetical protein
MSIVVSIMVLIDCNIKGTKKGNIKHTPEIRIIAPTRVLNLPKAENQPPNRSLGFQPFQLWTGTWAIFLILSVIFFL